jgi:hypothetical protein
MTVFGFRVARNYISLFVELTSRCSRILVKVNNTFVDPLLISY